MKAALRGSYVDYVVFTGVTDRYPSWFRKQLDMCTYTDESRFTFWVAKEERRFDYYEKQLIEDFSIIIRKPDGDMHIADYDVFQELYIVFGYDAFTNSGIAAYEDDCIEYVECKPGRLDAGYPAWFYEYFTEAISLPNEFEGFMLFADNDEVEVTEHSVILRNKIGEIKSMLYRDFIKYYDDGPSSSRNEFLKYNKDNMESSSIFGGL